MLVNRSHCLKPARRSGACRKTSRAVRTMATIQRFDCGARLSEMVIHNGTVYLAGQVPEDVSVDAKEQTASVLKQIDELLARAGTDKTRIISAQVFLRDLADFPQMNEAWDAWVASGHAPTRATVEAKLADPGWKVEIVVTAALEGTTVLK
ncbi:hypothetical protein PLESTB_001398000 [Pleodorina starrii]|uniref:Uncharacterized protein n=1 Tax=Pleodorina starrii TaxID=330485 RepID=A0A9W6BVT2_9CHLO|nr:hypothetical protein PLESTM_000534300 [Pleodorina starrii]GLC58760.1 hypothetical protein PLESTB_001398000 [Pleodorina starrii]GLC75154.1 hypothetical protein PLESTF_001601000 [Pleodorina starrii]